MKVCPYCWGKHERKRARYCCPEHQRLAANFNRRVQAGRRRAIDRNLQQQLERSRQVAA